MLEKMSEAKPACEEADMAFGAARESRGRPVESDSLRCREFSKATPAWLGCAVPILQPLYLSVYLSVYMFFLFFLFLPFLLDQARPGDEEDVITRGSCMLYVGSERSRSHGDEKSRRSRRAQRQEKKEKKPRTAQEMTAGRTKE